MIFRPGAWNWSWLFFAGLGSASVNTVYTYLGYYHICNLGAEIREPERNIPRAILISIAGIAVLYLAMQTSILGVVPWREAQNSQYIVSTFVERLYGTRAATFATIMILWIAFASLFTTLLSYSRVPFAAAEDGNFFPVFARVHPKKHFPHVSLLVSGRRVARVQRAVPSIQCDQGDHRRAADRAVHQPGRGRDDLAAALASGAASL